MLARTSSTPLTPRMASIVNTSSPLSSASPPSKAASLQTEWSFLRHLESLERPEFLVRILERDAGSIALFGETAKLAAQALFNSTAALTEPFGPDVAPMLTLQQGTQVGQLLQEFLLLRDGWRVEFWAWDSLRRAFKCTKCASAGNLESVEDLLNISEELVGEVSQSLSSASSSSASPVIAAVVMSQEGQVSLAWCDMQSFRIGYLQFADNALLTVFESALIQLGVRELLVQKESLNDKVTQIASACNLVCEALKSNEFFSCDSSQAVEADLGRLVGTDKMKMSEIPFDCARALKCLMSYLNLLGLDTNIGAFKLSLHNLKDFARLDEAALTSLNVFSKQQHAVNNASFSLFGLLDHCKTASGSRTLNQWLRQPLTNQQLIETRLDLVELFVQCSDSRHQLRESVFRGIPDMTKLVKKLIRARSSLQELVMLYQCVAKLHQILIYLDGDESIQSHLNFAAFQSALLGPMKSLTEQLSPFVQMIEETIDFDALSRNEYCLRADFDPELQELSKQKSAVLDAMEPEFRRVCQALKLEAGKKCKLERNSIYGHFFRISRLDAAKLSALRSGKAADYDNDDEDGNESGAGCTELATLKSGVLFTTPKLSDLARRYDALSEDYRDKQAVLVVSLLRSAQPFRSAFDCLDTLFAMMDVLMSVAHVAATSQRPYVRPRFSQSNEGMELKAARHACVEVQPEVSFIPNDAEFDRSSGKVLQFITGPNMGGKSTFIRQTAIIAILGQCGFFVPCDSASLPIFDAILVRVGAGDNINRGISTFMAEMLETATILQTATKNSLVIIDELGRGTSTCDGIALSRAISVHLAKEIGCFCYFATHFHELTALQQEFPSCIANLHVTVQEGGQVLLYRVVPGICDRSYGIHVAKTVGFPEAVLKMAQWRADMLEGTRPAELSSEEAEFARSELSLPPASLSAYF